MFRYHVGGELKDMDYFREMNQSAINHPEWIVWSYTKNYKALDEFLKYFTKNMLDVNNFTILVSIWHRTGIKTYNKYKELPFIKAFVYDDNTYKYSFDINTYCTAYDDNGHLNKDITCDKCRKCFNRLDSCKVIGCKAH